MVEQTSQNIPKGKLVGKIVHYFDKIGVGVIKAEAVIKVGDAIVVSGHGAEFEQAVDSMQVDHKPVRKIKKGEEAGMKLAGDAKEGASIYLKG